jgi:hypothetical protein
VSKIQAEFDKLKLSGHRHVTMEQFLKSVGIRIPHNTLEHDARHDLEPHLRDFHYDVMKIAMEHLSDEGSKL